MTPPYALKMFIWEMTTFERRRERFEERSPEMMAAAVSSQDVSIAKMFIRRLYQFLTGVTSRRVF